MAKGYVVIPIIFEASKSTTEEYIQDYSGLLYGGLPHWMRVD